MVVGTTLVSRENREVDWSLEIIHDLVALGVELSETLTEEDHGTTRSTEGLVGSSGDDVGVGERRGDHACGDETGDVRHVNDEVGADEVSNLANTFVVDEPTVGRGTGDDGLGAVEDGGLLEHVVVDYAGLEVNSVGHGLKVGGDSRDPAKQAWLAT